MVGAGGAVIGGCGAQVLAGAMRVRSLVAAAVAKADEQRTNLFLSAASHGDSDTVLQVQTVPQHPQHECQVVVQNACALPQCADEWDSSRADGSRTCPVQMLQQGFDSKQADYDGRTALMLAAAKGHANVARLLLAAHSDVSAEDLDGKTALDEACTHGHEPLIKLLARKGAK